MGNHIYNRQIRDSFVEEGDVEDNDNIERSQSPELPHSPAYQTYIQRTYNNRQSYNSNTSFMNNNLLESSPSNNSDTTVTYVDYADSNVYQQQPPRRKKKAGKRKSRNLNNADQDKPYNPYDRINSQISRVHEESAIQSNTNIISSQTDLEKKNNVDINVSHLESQELKNEKRWFSFLFSRKVTPVPLDSERELYPFKTSNFFFKLLFWWLWPILIRGYKRTLQPNDLYVLTPDVTVEHMHQVWLENLEKLLAKAQRKHLKKHKDLEEFVWPVWAIPYALFLTFKWQYGLSCILLAFSFCVQSLSPLITRRLIDYVEYRYFGLEKTLTKGIAYTLASVVLIFVNGLLLNHFFHTAMTTGAQSKAILTKALLLKSFDLSAKSRYLFPIGRITSLMSTDLARIDLAIGFQPLVICFPIPIIIAVVLLLTNIGVCSLSGIGLFIVSLIVCVALTKKLFDTRETVVRYTDERISLMREALTNLKVIKFYAWELAYRMNITKIREKEMKYLFTIKVLRNFITAYAVTLPTLTSMVSFVTMWATNNMKSPGKVFSSLSLFAILAQAIMLLPIALATGADALIGFTRCKDYLSAEEVDDELSHRLNHPIVNNSYSIGGGSEEGFEFKHTKPSTAVPMNNMSFSRSTNNDEYDYDYDSEDDEETVLEIKNANFIWESFHDELDEGLWDLSKDVKKKKEEMANKKKQARKDKKKRQAAYDEEKEVGTGSVSIFSEKHSSNPYETIRTTKETYSHSVESVASNSIEAFPGLVNINLSIKKSEFIIITGAIGTGKTSLLSAMAGIMKLDNPQAGKLKVYDDLLLCSAPWIQNATVRENILFGKPFDHDKYYQVLNACALEDDVAILPAGDNTEIGERGITLSGGQKARINLARACYTEAEILLFDDVISAVDSRVGKHIVDRLFKGLLRDKTIVLATHQLGILESADRIVFLNGDGSIDVGSVTELICRNENFQKLIDFSQESQAESANNSEYDLNINNMESDELAGVRLSEKRMREQADLSGRTMTEEEKATNGISWEVYKKYINLGSGIFGWTAAPVFLFLVSLATFCQVFTNTWLSFWIEKKFEGKSDKFYVTIYVSLSVLTVIFTAIEFTMLGYMNNRSAETLNVRAVNKILHAPMSFMDTTPIGRILNRFTKDTDSLDNEIGEQLRLFIFPLAMIIGIIILCICYLPWFAIAVPFLGFAFAFLANFYQGSSRELKRLEATQRSLVYNNFNETLTGMATIKSFRAENDFIKKNDLYLNKMNEAYFLSIATQRWLCVHLDMIACSFALIICMLCITEQFDISPSSTGLLMNYVIQIVGILALTIRAMTQVENEMNSVERLHEYAFNLPQEAAYVIPECQPPAEWPPSGYIEFKDVSLRYRPNLPLVLQDLNLNIYPGEKVGICGRTGAGKSSIMTALYRLTELEKGAITIDGLDISKMGLHDLRSNLSIIPQDPVLFQGSIRKNLDPFESYDDEVLLDALRRSGLLDYQSIDLVRRTKYNPKKNIGYDDLHKFHLDQLVDEDGNNFSLGERQLIALARSLVRNSKILILDEATSSVDFETDSKIQDTISNEFRQCSILCIAHRLKTILHYDRIIVMDKGRIVEKGAPTQLFQQNGIFKQMCDKANIRSDDFN